jgi:hypothetical protein
MRIPFIVAAAVALVAPAFGDLSQCVSGTYASYQALATGCAIGNTVFSNFSALASNISPGLPNVNAANISVSPVIGGTGLEFAYLGADGTPIPVVLSDRGEILALQLSYTVQNSGASIGSLSIDSQFAAVGDASVMASASVSPLLVTNVSTVGNGGKPQSNSTQTGNPAPLSLSFIVTDAIVILSQNGSATQNGFANVFSGGAGSVGGFEEATPEVWTSALVGSGLLCLGLLWRRRSRKE